MLNCLCNCDCKCNLSWPLLLVKEIERKKPQAFSFFCTVLPLKVPQRLFNFGTLRCSA